MTDYHITPKAPLIFRDGKPFGTGDNMADTLAFPQPSTIAGAMRTAYAESNPTEYKEYTLDTRKKLLKKTVRGPLLTCTRNGETHIMFAAPTDALCLADKGETYIHRLTPQKINNDEGCNLPLPDLTPVFLTGDQKGKPAKNSPMFWYQNKMIDWLCSSNSTAFNASEQGITNLPIETRTHVTIGSSTGTAETGHLFQTAGLDFGQQRKAGGGWADEQYGLACAFEGKNHNGEKNINSTHRTIGGEARLGHIQTADDNLIPACPDKLEDALQGKQYFRLILATPAIFTSGYLPSWICPETLKGEYHGTTLKLHAVATPRWQAGTSWDMLEGKNGKGMRTVRRLVPAGAVYWFEVCGDKKLSPEDWWLKSVSNESERANDGYGLALLGTWDDNISNTTQGKQQ